MFISHTYSFLDIFKFVENDTQSVAPRTYQYSTIRARLVQYVVYMNHLWSNKCRQSCHHSREQAEQVVVVECVHDVPVYSQ